MTEIVVFDFDGTLTRKDSFIDFIAFVHGRLRLFVGMMLNVHWIAAYFFHIISNEKLKQLLFEFFFRGMTHEAFCQYGIAFVSRINQIIRPDIVAQMKHHVAVGHTVIIISASIREWLLPWCEQLGVSEVLSTEVEVSADGILTGRFSTRNCYGPEKVARLLAIKPHRTDYKLTVYGDSRGDREIMELADEKYWVG